MKDNFLTEEQKIIYKNYGAIVIKNVFEPWILTLQKGFDKVLQNSISGTSSGMPPKGGNMDLTDAQVKKLVEYMINLSK